MTRQGYLIVHEKRGRPSVHYFSLEDGFLRKYASAECNQCQSEVQLSGCKIAVKAQKRVDGVPNSFYLETRKVFVKDRSYTLGNVERLEFSACSAEDRQDWGKALFSWQRYYWRDPEAASSAKDSAASETRVQLEEVIAKHYVVKPPIGHPISFSVAKTPMSFLRRNAHSLRRSLSLTTVTNTSKPESEADSTDCVKDKVVLANVECPEDSSHKSNNICKAAAVTPHFFPTQLARGNNQKAH